MRWPKDVGYNEEGLTINGRNLPEVVERKRKPLKLTGRMIVIDIPRENADQSEFDLKT